MNGKATSRDGGGARKNELGERRCGRLRAVFWAYQIYML